MCTNYTPTARVRLKAMQMGVEHLPVSDWPPEIFPGYEAPIIVAAGQNGAQCLLAKFGLMPRWSKDAKHAAELARGTYNSRSETAAIKPSFRSPWRESQFALAPMENFYEPCWETVSYTHLGDEHSGWLGRAIRPNRRAAGPRTKCHATFP